jgi:hypothetical protein
LIGAACGLSPVRAMGLGVMAPVRRNAWRRLTVSNDLTFSTAGAVAPADGAVIAQNVQQVLAATKGESDNVKQAALTAVGAQIPPPTWQAANILWVILVTGLAIVLVLSALALMHVIGTGITEDKIVTVFSTVLAGLLGLFAKSPTG